MELNKLSHTIIGAAMKVHSALGPGLLEMPYKQCLRHELIKAGLKTLAEVPLHVTYDAVDIEIGYRLDLVVEDHIILELKSVEHLAPLHKMQLLTYLKLSRRPLGLLINFNVRQLKDGIVRLIN